LAVGTGIDPNLQQLNNDRRAIPHPVPGNKPVVLGGAKIGLKQIQT